MHPHFSGCFNNKAQRQNGARTIDSLTCAHKTPSKAIEEGILFICLLYRHFYNFIYNLIHIPGVLNQWMKKWEYRFLPQLLSTSVGLVLSWGWWLFVCLFIIVLSFILLNHFLRIALPTFLQQPALQRPYYGVSHHPLPSSELALPIENKQLFVLNPLSQGQLQEDPWTKTDQCLSFHFNPGY